MKRIHHTAKNHLYRHFTTGRMNSISSAIVGLGAIVALNVVAAAVVRARGRKKVRRSAPAVKWPGWLVGAWWGRGRAARRFFPVVLAIPNPECAWPATDGVPSQWRSGDDRAGVVGRAVEAWLPRDLCGVVGCYASPSVRVMATALDTRLGWSIRLKFNPHVGGGVLYSTRAALGATRPGPDGRVWCSTNIETGVTVDLVGGPGLIPGCPCFGLDWQGRLLWIWKDNLVAFDFGSGETYAWGLPVGTFAKGEQGEQVCDISASSDNRNQIVFASLDLYSQLLTVTTVRCPSLGLGSGRVVELDCVGVAVDVLEIVEQQKFKLQGSCIGGVNLDVVGRRVYMSITDCGTGFHVEEELTSAAAGAGPWQVVICVGHGYRNLVVDGGSGIVYQAWGDEGGHIRITALACPRGPPQGGGDQTVELVHNVTWDVGTMELGGVWRRVVGFDSRRGQLHLIVGDRLVTVCL